MKNRDISIRRASLDDIAALSDLIIASVRTLGAQHYTEQQIESALQYQYAGVDTRLIEDGTYFVAEADCQIVGCGGWSRRRSIVGGDGAKQAGDEDDLLNPACDAARIRAFFVHPDWARCGIGRALMEVSETDAKAAGFRRLELWATYGGVPLYQSHGFQIVRAVENTFPNGVSVSGLYMAKTLE